ncbi:MAG: ParB N-terminal domain-containing protein [Verrucomicrobiae bacterium]|nr:ParB N-terminal domain-containing protein [Verrucomicrobiae bacterium]
MTKTETRDPQDLKLHPLHKKHIPQPDTTGAEWASFVEDIRSGGIVDPLAITPDGLIMSGGRRWAAAKQLQLTEVPVVVRPDGEAVLIIISTLIQRRHMTRGAAIYLALGMMPEFIAAAEIRRLANLRKGVKTPENPLKSPKPDQAASGPETVEELCTRWGISRDTYDRAVKVRKIFADPKKEDFKKAWEPKLMSGEASLWNVISADCGEDTDQSGRQEGIVLTQLELAFERIGKHASAWGDLKEGQREEILIKWRATAAMIPKPLRKTIIEILEEA